MGKKEKECDCLPDEMCETCFAEKQQLAEASDRGFKTVQEMKAFDLKIEVKLNQIKAILSGMSISDIEFICELIPVHIRDEQTYTYKIINTENKENSN